MGGTTSQFFDLIYESAKASGALGGKILGAGGGGYFLFYCPTRDAKESVRRALTKFDLRETPLCIDTMGARVKILDF